MDSATRAPLSLTEFLRMATAYPVFGAGQLAPDARAFLEGVFADASSDALFQARPADALAIVADLFAWARDIGPAGKGVRVRAARGADGRPLGRDVLEIVGLDAPFLVDSTIGELAEQGIVGESMFHPVATGADGSARSFIVVLLKPLRAAQLERLRTGVQATLADVRLAVADYPVLKQRMLACAAELEASAAQARDEIAEGAALLRWLADNRFTFLGARDYEYARDATGALAPVEPIILETTGLGLLRDPNAFVLRASNEPMLLTPQWREMLNDPSPIVFAKSTFRSRVHRRTSADYVGVKRYDAQGRVIGETRFIGLLTTEAFTEPTRTIPLLRRKVAWVVEQAGYRPGGHSEKTLRHIIETYPREELWQITAQDLLETAVAISHLMDRPRPRVFVRRDRFNRFLAALAYLPKDRYNSTLREAVGHALERAYGGQIETFEPTLGEGPLARVYFRLTDIDRMRIDPPAGAIDDEIAALATTWEDRFQEAVSRTLGDSDETERIRKRFSRAFSAGYRERNGGDEALEDIEGISGVAGDGAVRIHAFHRPGDAKGALRAKIFAKGGVLALSQLLPILENLGLFIEGEVNYEVMLAADGDQPAQEVHIHELEMRTADPGEVDLIGAQAVFEDAFLAVLDDRAENDGFNKLVIKLGVDWRRVALLRALARYRQQTGLDPSQTVQESALAGYPDVALQILELFRLRFDPDLVLTMPARDARAKEIEEKIAADLEKVASLDEDRALRRIAALVAAIKRTNYYQPYPAGAGKPYMSFKIASRDLENLPAPKPHAEIWVAGPQVEGVHLRMGPVARGGLRWSDRRDDFRAEVLDLVKAQQVKNAIIVPVGAKGGFFAKKLPPRGAPDFMEVGIAAYRTFLSGLLDITDNIAGGAIAAPRDVVRWDSDDPYLVVAADKGTATFSDIANDVAASYGFWLGDAFASGGSKGYDHKAMAITARGAWEAVKRHFREIGKNIQEEAFDVIGVGDMSGDVFGNGMLLSKKIRLRAAFDHRHIFLDPNPADLDASWVERERLFKLPRSSWDDYNKALISHGGGVFARSLKSIAVSPEIAALTGITAPTLTPSELIIALLTAQTELLWFGGIGTFIKARSENNLDVADKANDAHRVNGEDVRAAVIGEGANLGVTQAGRIGFARRGGRINTDAVDNSAGVDTSDHEVNIKILLGDVIEAGKLPSVQREPLLAQMTDDVAAHVLAHNYNQTLALSLAEASAAADLASHERMIQRLEAAGKLSRAVEGLPSAEEFRARAQAGQGLTRPELAKLVAYAKIDLFDALVASEAPDDPAFRETLHSYFPPALAGYDDEMRRHRLRREIISTTLADDVINLGGPTFVDRIHETHGVSAVAIACAFEAVRRVFEVDAITARINALDNHAPAALQHQLHREVVLLLRRVTGALAHASLTQNRNIADIVSAYASPLRALRAEGAAVLSDTERANVEQRRTAFIAAGAPADLANDVALLAALASAIDVADLATARALPISAAARLYHAIGAAFGLDALRASASALPLASHWDRLAMRRTLDDLARHQLALAQTAASSIAAPANAQAAQQAVREWIEASSAATLSSIDTIKRLGEGGWTFAKAVLAAAEVQSLVRTTG